ncbi:MAG: YebC/PmpR family DNA-binding transcriptional regulator [Planctomycetota bacterium]|jgi:YebC/PmpR family DNA-binding regulatory protein
MAGHSHWAGIKHKKGVVDARRGKLFSKLARSIITAARLGGGDPDMNLRLKYAVDKARAANMPKDNIERAIKRGSGAQDGDDFEELVYEGYGPTGVAVMVEALTDNRNRTASEVRKIFERRGGNLGESGSVGWMFERQGLFTLDRDAIDEEDLVELAVEAGAENVESEGGIYEVTCDLASFEGVRQAFLDRELTTRVAEIARIPKSKIQAESQEDAKKILGFMDDLEDLEDVQNVYANFDIPEDILKKIEEEAE